MIEVDTILNFGSHRVQHTFAAERNRIVLFGASGAGKSVLLKMIAGFFNPDHGRIIVGSKVLFDSTRNINLPVHQRRIGYLSQEYTLFPNMNVIDNILYGIRVQKKTVDKQQFDKLVARLDIEKLLKRSPESLSGGQQQRVALARTLIIRPDILLLDEPFNALDSSIRETLRDLVTDLVDELNIPSLLVTHSLDEAFVFAKELILVSEGRVIEAGDRDSVYLTPRHVESAQLLGFANLFQTAEISANRALLPGGDRFVFTQRFSPDQTVLCIRPEDIMILREDRGKAIKPANLVSGVISALHHHGRQIKIEMITESGLILRICVPVHVYQRLTLEKGSRIRAFLKEESIVMCHPEQTERQ